MLPVRSVYPSSLFRGTLLGLLVLALSPLSASAISSRLVVVRNGTDPVGSFGESVAAGDFNGDGFADHIVGAPLTNVGVLTDAGRATLYVSGAGFSFSGPAAGDHLGQSVAFAGDFNGDGFDDLIIGAPTTDVGALVDAGRAYVYFGGPSFDLVADLTLSSSVAGELFGYSVASAGDWNHDGFDDVIVGAWSNDQLAVDAGKAYLVLGGSTPDANVDLTLDGSVASGFFGYSVASAEDINRDGFDDIVVGAYGSNGAAFVYFGGLSGLTDAVADLTLTGVAAEQLGYSVASAGDMNGDGNPDLIVGAPSSDANGVDAGRAYLYFGGPAADAVADLTLTGTSAGDNLGSSVASGDVNGDGFADLLVGANNAGAVPNEDGLAYIYLGGSTLNSVADLILSPFTGGQAFGLSVASAGDLDGDGNSDVIVGDPSDALGGTVGRAYAFAIYPYQILLPNGGETWVAGAPATVRWRGHDVADLAISTDGGLTYDTIFSSIGGAEENEFTLTAPATPTDAAKVRLTFRAQSATRGNSDVSNEAFRIVLPAPPPAAAERLQVTPTGTGSNHLGGSVASAGDMNGDGFDDFLVGAQLGGAGNGAAYVYFGGPGSDATPDLTLLGEAASDAFGIPVAPAGDVNGDGFDDVIVGASFNDAGGPVGDNRGRAYVFYGGNPPNAVADLVLTGEAAGDQFGFSAASAGDFNGDGFSDVVVGAPFRDNGAISNVGRAYVYFGGVVANTVADFTFTGLVAGDNMGRSVGAAGDVNGDGIGDVIVGVPGADAPLKTDVGQAQLIIGSRFIPASILTLTGAAANDNFGRSVGGADVDGDGFSDLLVGADLKDALAGSDAGAAYVYSGGNPFDLDDIPELTLLGEFPGDQFGTSVASAGDANGDGFDDVVIGAYHNDGRGSNAGRAYVFYGAPFGTAGGTSPDLAFEGEAAGDEFGGSVASAGDINGDGFDDIIVGAQLNTAGGASAGRAYVLDLNRYHVLGPNGGETWNVGGLQDISWLGAEPADVWLSVDAGRSFDRLRTGVGGLESNKISIQVPHAPTRFALVKVTPTHPSLKGQDQSDARFTIQASVGLLSLVATLTEHGAELTWETSPGVAPEGLVGYRLYRVALGDAGNGTRIGPGLITENRYSDHEGIPGSTYRLTGVNGLQEELELGRVTLEPAIIGLRAWPSPVAPGSALNVAFAAPLLAPGYPATDLDVGVFDIHGRRIATLARGLVVPRAGVVSLAWDLRGDYAPGMFFVRASAPSASYAAERKVVVIR